jgi:hypothetical protein
MGGSLCARSKINSFITKFASKGTWPWAILGSRSLVPPLGVHLLWLTGKGRRRKVGNGDLGAERWWQGTVEPRWRKNFETKAKELCFWQYWGLNSGPMPWATPPSLFCKGFFQDSISQTICPCWPQTLILLICASWVARITGMSHWCLALFYFLSKMFIMKCFKE